MAALISVLGLKLIVDFFLELPTGLGAYQDDGHTNDNTGSRILIFLLGLYLMVMSCYWIFIKL